MFYTIAQVAKISGLSIRTLRFYDEINLFKPAKYGDNKYRYYQESQLLMLQQILCYRQLGFALKDIKTIITASDFDLLKSLKQHRKFLIAQAQNIEQLLITIDNTIQHIQGKKMIPHTDFYKGFDIEKQHEHEQYIMQKYTKGKELVSESNNAIKNWKKEDWDSYHARNDAVHTTLAQLMRNKHSHESQEVQQAIAEHFKIITLFYTPTAEVYAGLGDLYIEHPEFRAFFDAYDQALAPFMAQAMKCYAQHIT